LRTASILLCNDAATDHRVDPEACRELGIRSIVVVPLRGPMGISGILEAFSAHPGAFGDEEINCLRGLAEIAEVAYEREYRLKDGPAPSTAPTSRPTRVVKLSKTDHGVVAELLDEPSNGRRYWVLGVAAVALLLTCAVMWLSWRDPTPELAASEPPARTLKAAEVNSSNTPPQATPAKPQPGIASRQAEHSKPAGMLQNAADIQPAGKKSGAGNVARDVSPAKRSAEGVASSPTPTFEPEQPPTIEVAASVAPDTLAKLGSGPAALPALDVKVSEGVTPAILMHRVDPIYPPAARVKRLDGSVTLDATIATDGNVRAVKILTGSQLLAAAAETAVRQWRYSPARLSGKPVEIQKQITIVFKLP
jgi:protein TonB